MMKKLRWNVLIVLYLMWAFTGVHAIGAGYPEKPIEFTVPFAAGGGSDIMARTIAAIIEREKILPQPLVVVNRAGASGVLGYMHVGQKTGDPYRSEERRVGKECRL